jgi:hypothetical protein
MAPWLQVKSMFVVSHPVEAQKLAEVGKHAYGRLLEVWRELVSVHPYWQELMTYAEAADYERVSEGLCARFD